MAVEMSRLIKITLNTQEAPSYRTQSKAAVKNLKYAIATKLYPDGQL